MSEQENQTPNPETGDQTGVGAGDQTGQTGAGDQSGQGGQGDQSGAANQTQAKSGGKGGAKGGKGKTTAAKKTRKIATPAPRKSITSIKGIIAHGDEVKAADLNGGQQRIDALKKSGVLVETEVEV